MAMMETQEKAQQLLKQVQAYWAERGYEVQGTIKAQGYSPRLRSTVYEVVTDMVAGLPSNYRKAS